MTTTDDGPAPTDATERPLPTFATVPVLAMAAGVAVVMAALGARYGYHRDELYYLAGGDRLEWGYVDHPPLVPALARLVDSVSGGSLVALRAVGACFAGTLVALCALVARELGGGRRSQVLAAFVALAAPTFRSTELLLGTTGADMVVWAVVLLLTARLLRTENPQWWLPIGLVVGIGLETKWLVLVLVAGLVIGMAADRRRSLLASPWLVAGAAVAIAAWAPNLIWNAQHDWALVEFQLGVRGRQGAVDARIEYVVGQLLITGVIGVVIWWPGLRWLLGRTGDERSAPFRPLAIAAITVVVGLAVAGAKLYYPAPLYLPLFAAGAVSLAEPVGRRRRTYAVATAMLVLLLPITLPMLPPAQLATIAPVFKEFGEMVGWEELAAQVEDAWTALPPDQRERTIVLTVNYGEAGAIERFAPDVPVYSAHNSVWWWGPPPDAATDVIAVGYDLAFAAEHCEQVTELGTVTNPFELENDELGAPIVLCEGITEPWSTAWDDLRHYS